MKVKIFTGSQEQIRDAMAQDAVRLYADQQGVKAEDATKTLKEDPDLLQKIDSSTTLFDDARVLTFYGPIEGLLKTLAEMDGDGENLLVVSTPTFAKSKAKGVAKEAEVIALPPVKNPADITQFYLSSVEGFPADSIREISSYVGREVKLLPLAISSLRAQFGSKLEGVAHSDIMRAAGSGEAPAPWDLTDAVDSGNLPRALTLSRRLQEGKGSPYGVLAILGNHANMMFRLAAAGVTNEHHGVQMLGHKGSPYPIKKAINTARRHGMKKLAKMVELIDAAQNDITGGTSLDSSLVVDILISRITKM